MREGHFLGPSAELVALYVAGALRHNELAAFEAHLAAGCDACEQELRRLNPIATALRALQPAGPDPKTRDALLARVGTKPRSRAGESPLRPLVARTESTGPSSYGIFTKKASEASWEKTAVEGVSIRTLFVDRENNQFTALVRMAAGASYPRHVHGGPEGCLVLEGDLCVGDDVLQAGDYQRAPAGSHHGLQSTSRGCLLLITSSLTDQFV